MCLGVQVFQVFRCFSVQFKVFQKLNILQVIDIVNFAYLGDNAGTLNTYACRI